VYGREIQYLLSRVKRGYHRRKKRSAVRECFWELQPLPNSRHVTVYPECASAMLVLYAVL
jgi:hypothetical protein